MWPQVCFETLSERGKCPYLCRWESARRR